MELLRRLHCINIRLGLNCLTVENILAKYNMGKTTAAKSFIIQTGGNIIKHFKGNLTHSFGKLGHLRALEKNVYNNEMVKLTKQRE